MASFLLKTTLLFISLNCISLSALNLDERVQNLFLMSHKKGIIEFDTQKFETYIRERPRNYSVIAMTTAMSPKRGCSVCQEAANEYKILYNSFRSNNQKDFIDKKLFFVTIDYDQASEVFTQLKVNSAPGFYHFPDSNTKTTKADKLDLSRTGFQAQSLAKWVNERTGVSINVVRPPSYTTFLIIIGMTGLVLSLGYMSGFQVEWIYNKRIWAMISISIILLIGLVCKFLEKRYFLMSTENYICCRKNID